MNDTINVKTLRNDMGEILRRVERGESFTLLYRSRPVARLVPMEATAGSVGDVQSDPLFGAGPVGYSEDGGRSEDHDEVIYTLGHRQDPMIAAERSQDEE